MNTLREIAAVIKSGKSAAIFTHIRPDGDALGGAMALCRALQICGVRAEVVNEGEIPSKFFFLQGMNEIKRQPSPDAEIYICVDSSDETRLGALEPAFRAGAKRKVTVNIDHHVSNTRYCKYNYVEARSSSCEIVAALIRALEVVPDSEIANFLMLGMVTDSGGFSHADVKGDTFREAAFAADHGADVAKITYETMRRQSKPRAEFYAEVIGNLRYLNGDTLAVAIVSDAQLKKYGLKSDATEGVVDFALTVDGVEVSVCLLETGNGQFKASLRSKGKVNVNEIARVFGGGGHVLASGCMLFGELEEVLDRLRDVVDRHTERT